MHICAHIASYLWINVKDTPVRPFIKIREVDHKAEFRLELAKINPLLGVLYDVNPYTIIGNPYVAY